MTGQQRDWPGADSDPEGAEFYLHPAKPPESDWAYILDDSAISYQRGILWPFRSAERTGVRSDREMIRAWQRAGRKRGENWQVGPGCGWRNVRLSPDTEYRAWRNEYIGVWPDTREAHKASADLHLYVRPQGQGAVVLNCTLILDLRDMTGTVTTWPIEGSPAGLDGFSEDFPEALKAQATEKKVKILAFLAETMARRDAGKRKIETAHECWLKAGKP